MRLGMVVRASAMAASLVQCWSQPRPKHFMRQIKGAFPGTPPSNKPADVRVARDEFQVDAIGQSDAAEVVTGLARLRTFRFRQRLHVARMSDDDRQWSDADQLFSHGPDQ